jgi:chromosome segregation ATPase
MATVEMEVGDQSGTNWRSPLRKLVKFFARSRDRWKAKYLAKKEEYKRMGNQARAVEKSRAMWRETAERAQQQIRRLEQELREHKKSAA